MSAASDYLYFRNVVGSDKSTQAAFLATGATGVSLISARNSVSHLNIQRIRLSPTTFVTGALLFGAVSSGTGVFANLAQPAALAVAGDDKEQITVLDFGPVGHKLAAGAALFMVRSATGSAGTLFIEAYETSSTGPLAIATTN